MRNIDASAYAESDTKWLNVDLLKSKGLTRAILRITDVSEGQYKDGTKHLALHFFGTEKILGLNKTNLRTVISLYGPDTVGWMGKQIAVFVTQTFFDGKSMDCLRIEPQPPQKQIEAVPHQPRRMSATGLQNGGRQIPSNYADHNTFKSGSLNAPVQPPGHPDMDELPEDGDPIPF